MIRKWRNQKEITTPQTEGWVHKPQTAKKFVLINFI